MASHTATFTLKPGKNVEIRGILHYTDEEYNNWKYTSNITISGYGPMDNRDWDYTYIDGGLYYWSSLFDMCIDETITVQDGITSLADGLFERYFGLAGSLMYYENGIGHSYTTGFSSLGLNGNFDTDILTRIKYEMSTEEIMIYNGKQVHEYSCNDLPFYPGNCGTHTPNYYVKNIVIGKDVVKIGDNAFRVDHYDDSGNNINTHNSNYGTTNFKGDYFITPDEIEYINQNDSREKKYTYYLSLNDYHKDIGNGRTIYSVKEFTLNSITFKDPTKIEYIGDLAFAGLTNIRSLDFGGHTPAHIGISAFEGCTYLEKLNFDEDITLSPRMFAYCNCLESFNKHNSIKEIIYPGGFYEDNEALIGCCSLKAITFNPECNFGKQINNSFAYIDPMWCSNPSLSYKEEEYTEYTYDNNTFTYNKWDSDAYIYSNRLISKEKKTVKLERQITYIHGNSACAVAHAWTTAENRLIKYDDGYDGGVPSLVLIIGGLAQVIQLAPIIWERGIGYPGNKDDWYDDTNTIFYPVMINNRTWYLVCRPNNGKGSALLSMPYENEYDNISYNDFSVDNYMEN